MPLIAECRPRYGKVSKKDLKKMFDPKKCKISTENGKVIIRCADRSRYTIVKKGENRIDTWQRDFINDL